MANWPLDRPETYNADEVWDEGTESWVAVDAQGGSRYQVQIVVISDQGVIYFGNT